MNTPLQNLEPGEYVQYECSHDEVCFLMMMMMMMMMMMTGSIIIDV